MKFLMVIAALAFALWMGSSLSGHAAVDTIDAPTWSGVQAAYFIGVGAGVMMLFAFLAHLVESFGWFKRGFFGVMTLALLAMGVYIAGLTS